MSLKITSGFFLVALSVALSTQGITGECRSTPHRTTGTHYEPVTVEKVDIGEGLMVWGRVLAAPGCKPVANAKVAHWQAGEDGRYTDKLRAYLYTDAKGRYYFETEWPNMRSPHIHFIVTADGYRKLETQWIGRRRSNDIVFNMVLIKE